MTSSPLFIIVAQSTVIFLPMRQGGWPTRVLKRFALWKASLLQVRTRAAGRGQDEPLGRFPFAPSRHWKMERYARCLTGRSRRRALRAFPISQFAPR